MDRTLETGKETCEMRGIQSDADGIHTFEEAELGKAPFRFVGAEDKSVGTDADGLIVIGETKDGIKTLTKPGGSCDYCGAYIVRFFWIESADGRRFKVGSECVTRTGDRGIIDLVKREKRRIDRRKRHAREAEGILAGKALFEERGRELQRLPHPLGYRAAKGETLRQYVGWMLYHAGTSGKIKAIRAMKKALA